ncbi:uncharacterized protein Dvar_29900 [Desulfosarcina variabilis str. Montpellier]|uniref:hypothetical protein n=1 Tax=Desulfosarcina variabilis TaxID=2300 RepID=UPI003AFB393E
MPIVSRSDVVARTWATPLSLVFIDGGQAPWEVFKLAVSSGRFVELPRVKSLGVLKKIRTS